MAADIEVSLLGPLEVRTGDRTSAIAGVKLQSLLGLLALAVPHGVSDDRLLDELWGDDPPAKPANALQALVSHLRRLLGRETLVRHGNGYALRVEPQAVDALRLEQLVHDGLARRQPATTPPRRRASAPPSISSADRRSPSSPTSGSPARPSPASTSWSSPPTRAWSTASWRWAATSTSCHRSPTSSPAIRHGSGSAPS